MTEENINNDELVDLEEENIDIQDFDDQENKESGNDDGKPQIDCALGCLKLNINYNYFQKKINFIGAKLYLENNKTKNINTETNDMFKIIIDSQDIVEKDFFKKYPNIHNCKIVGKLRENNQFIINNNYSNSKKLEKINVDFCFKNGYFQTNWMNINLCKTDYFQFIEKLSENIKKYYKTKKNSNVLIRAPDYLLFDLKAYEPKKQ
jgi:hypothetical protein